MERLALDPGDVDIVYGPDRDSDDEPSPDAPLATRVQIWLRQRVRGYLPVRDRKAALPVHLETLERAGGQREAADRRVAEGTGGEMIEDIPEAGPEAGREAGPEAGREAGPEPGPEGGPEAGPEESPEETPEPRPAGSLDPPVRKPPTAVGAGVPRPDGEPVPEIVVGRATRLDELARRVDASPPRILSAAFEDLGLMATVDQQLSFDETRRLAARFGYRARLREEWEP